MQPEPQVTDSAQSTYKIVDSDHLYNFSRGIDEDRLAAIHQEMEFVNTIGKSFVAAIDRFHVHRALLAALQDLYSFSACCVLLKGEPPELIVLPCQPLSAAFLEDMMQRIVKAANFMDFPSISLEQLKKVAYFDAPDEVAQFRTQEAIECTEIGSILTIPLTVDNRIIGLLSLFDELIGTFDSKLLSVTTMIADYAAVALDNARLRERENALWRETELERRRLELILRSMAESLLITNEQGAVTALNASARQLFTEQKIELKLNVPLREQEIIRHHPWLNRLIELIEQVQTGETVTNQELTLGEQEETIPLTLSVSAAPLQDHSNSDDMSSGVVVVLNDITSTKHVERLKDEFISVASHELRTPLTAIKGYTQHLVRRIERRLRKARDAQQPSLQSTADLPESYDLRSLNIIQSQTQQLERLVSDLLDRSQIQQGQLTLNYETFHLADVLAECVTSVQNSSEQHTIYLDIQIHDTQITADRPRVSQVTGNILDNAVKYSPQGGQITVSLKMRDGQYYIEVVDQGIGISTEYYNRIFERFYRVRNSLGDQYAGIGLGLYIAKAIVERHGGTIGFFKNKNIGTTFYFTLPPTPPI